MAVICRMKERLGGSNSEKERHVEGGKQMKAEEEKGGGTSLAK